MNADNQRGARSFAFVSVPDKNRGRDHAAHAQTSGYCDAVSKLEIDRVRSLNGNAASASICVAEAHSKVYDEHFSGAERDHAQGSYMKLLAAMLPIVRVVSGSACEYSLPIQNMELFCERAAKHFIKLRQNPWLENLTKQNAAVKFETTRDWFALLREFEGLGFVYATEVTWCFCSVSALASRRFGSFIDASNPHCLQAVFIEIKESSIASSNAWRNSEIASTEARRLRGEIDVAIRNQIVMNAWRSAEDVRSATEAFSFYLLVKDIEWMLGNDGAGMHAFIIDFGKDVTEVSSSETAAA